MSIEALEKASAEQGAAVAALKKEKAPKDKVDAAVAELLKRKAALKEGLEAAVVEAKAAGDSARLAALEEKIAAATPRPPTHKKPKEEAKKEAPPPKSGGEKAAKKGGGAKEAAPAKPAPAANPAPAAAPASSSVAAGTPPLADLVGLSKLNAHLEGRSYIEGGAAPTQADVAVLRAVVPPDAATHPHAARWYAHLQSFTGFKLANLPGKPTTLAPAKPTTVAPPLPQRFGVCEPVSSTGMAGGFGIAGGFEAPFEPVCRGSHPKWYPPPADKGQRVTGLRMHNSLTSEKELFVPKEGNKVTWYTCGPTVYDACHMGHARAYLTNDIIRRLLEDYFGYEVFMQINVTDVDDKIIARARRNKLLADFTAKREAEAKVDAAKAAAALKKEVEEATAAFDAKMQKKLAKLEVPLDDRREEDERQTLLEQHRQKLQSWKETAAKIGAAVKGGQIQAMCAAAAEPLAETLDSQFGSDASWNDAHEIFNAHSRRYEAEFIEDMVALNIRMPDALTRVTEYVEEIVDYVKTIVHKGMAYESNGSVYMDIGALRGGAHDYPKLEPSKGKATQAEMEESEGAHTAEAGEKRNPADFALWKKSKGGEPSWASPWGGGRPGWHIECSVMASDLMGDGMDVHAGGSDLKFPHHDNELAQAEAYHGCCQWVNYFLHFGHLHIKGLKMSKSLKNFVTIRQALATHSARQIRLMFLLQPWDKQMNYSDQTIEEAEKRETSFKSYFAEVKDQLRKNWLGKPTKWDARSRELAARLAEHQSAVHECLCDNFNTPGAMAALLAIVSDANSYVTKNSAVDALLLKKGATYVTRILRIFGVATQEDFGFPVGAEGAGGYEEHVAPVVSAMVAFRDEVRAAAKGTPALMKACDELRDEKLVELGVRVEDRADGARWTLDDPATLRQEQAAKKAKEAETRVQKLLNKLGDKAKDIAKVEAAMVPAEEFLRRPPHAAKYAPDSYDEQGKPSKDAAGGALSKSMVKEVEKLHKKQVEAYAKQKAQLDAKPGLLGEMEAALAAMQAEARAVVADKATMAVLSEEVVAQLEASMGAAETSGAAGASAEEDWRKKEAEELKAKQAAEAKKAAEKAKAEEEAAAKAAALEAAGKKVAGGLHKFDASEVDVNGGSATADDFMDAFGF